MRSLTIPSKSPERAPAHDARLACLPRPMMVIALTLILSYWRNFVATSSLIEVQVRAACTVMIAVMLARFRLYSTPPGHARAA